jgi:phospholipid N-methyltransferase
MARSYNVRLVALTLECDPKWVDNLLSHHPLPGVYQSRQGVERRVSDEGLVAIEATRMLACELGLPLAKAVAITSEAMRRRAEIETGVVTTSGIALSLPFASLESRIRARLLEAIEALGRVQRGRPRSRAVEE